MKKNLILFLMVIINNLNSQNRAPSLYLNYQDNFSGDIIINTLRVPNTSPVYTYYCSLLWGGSEGTGYAGFQEHPNGRNFIFSMWNPSSTNIPITADYIGSGTIFEPFGGEGEGRKSTNYSIGWEINQWYTFVSRSWNGKNNNTLFGYWVFDNSNQKWTHVVTFNYPVPNLGFNTRTSSFIEDWLGNGWLERQIHHKEGWKRRSSDKMWKPFTSSQFDRVYPDAGTVNYIEKYDGGNNSEFYFMKSGGSASPVTNTAGTMLYVPNDKIEPTFSHGKILSFSTSTSLNKVNADWSNDSSTLPQFSYSLFIYDNPSFSGNPSKQQIEISPQSRSAFIDTTDLINGKTYYVKFFISDIFDKISTISTTNFVANTTNLSVSEFSKSLGKIYPNPVDDNFFVQLPNNFTHTSLDLTLLNPVGQVIFKENFNNIRSKFKVTLKEKIPVGQYILIVEGKNLNEKFLLLKR